jgi:group I intron endonuclease
MTPMKMSNFINTIKEITMFIVYKTTNIINGHYYIGVHKQFTDSFDGYLGSGTGLKRAIEKHGVKYFQRQTLFSFDNVEDAYDKENELLNSLYKLNECYNMRPGGRGIRGKIHFHSDEWKKKVSDAHKGKKLSEQTIEKIKKYDRSYMKTDEYRSAMSKAQKGKPSKLKGRRGFTLTSIKVETPFGVFLSLREASDKLNISLYYVTKWAKNNENGYSLI